MFPTRWDLDKVCAEQSGHSRARRWHGAVANSAALKIAGIDKNTPSPFGGEISKDKQSGEPNGMLLDAAQDLVRRHIPRDYRRRSRTRDRAGRETRRRTGLDPGSGSGRQLSPRSSSSKNFTAKARSSCASTRRLSAPGREAQRLFQRRPNHRRLRQSTHSADASKLYADGSLGSRSAALLEPYSDEPDTSGFLTIKEEDLLPMLERSA